MRSDPLSVLVVEDHPVVRESLASFIEATEGVTLWGTADSGEDAVSQLGRAEQRPRVALADLSMPGMNGIELVAKVRTSWPDVVCVILSAHRASVYATRALAAGAAAYVEKSDMDALVSALLGAAHA